MLLLPVRISLMKWTKAQGKIAMDGNFRKEGHGCRFLPPRSVPQYFPISLVKSDGKLQQKMPSPQPILSSGSTALSPAWHALAVCQNWFPRRPLSLILHLPPLPVQMIPLLINQLRHRHEFIPLLFQPCNQFFQRLGRILRPVMAADDRSIFQIPALQHIVQYSIHSIIFPIQRIHIPTYRIIPAFCRRTYHTVIIIPIRRTE